MLPRPTTAVLLMAYGSPQKPEDVREFYTDIRGGKAPAEELITEIESRYRIIGGETPLNRITQSQADETQKVLDTLFPGKYKVYVGMKHWIPRINDTVAQIQKDGMEEIIALVLAPHYSIMSIGGYKKKLEQILEDLDYHPKVTFIESWYQNPHFIDCVVEQIGIPHSIVVFTSHSLPEKILALGDPYKDQLLATCNMIAEKFDSNIAWQFAFQSAGRTGEAWLGPEIKEVIKKLAAEGYTQVIICPIGFVVDNLEILYDLDVDLIEFANTLGVTITRVPLRNTHPTFIQAIVSEVTRG